MVAIKLENLTKSFGEFKAVDNINLEIKSGEIHALLGENGAGKSTLMNLIFGMYTIDAGNVYINEKKAIIKNPQDAFKLGIGMVHQHFKLVDNFTVFENIVLGDEDKFLNSKKSKEKYKDIEKLIKKYKFNLDLDKKIYDISVAEQQKVEILKVLYKESEILIFDEPTGVLSLTETKELLKIMKQLQSEGKTIILITHKLDEIKQVANKCSVIRRGKIVGEVKVKDIDEAELARLMVGDSVKLFVDRKIAKPQDVVIKLENISYMNTQKIQKLKNINLELYSGSILAIAGVDNNGQKELVESLVGLNKKYTGNIKYYKDGNEINLRDKSVKEINKGIISHVPEDRHRQGLILDYKVDENSIMINYGDKKFSKNSILKKDKIKEFSKKIIKNYDVRTSNNENTKTLNMSGGNQQKLIIGRQIELDADVLVVFCPTRGVDVGAIEFIHTKILEQRDKGCAVLLISMELDEVFALSDRIAVINNGEIVDIVKTDDVGREDVGLLMTGQGGNK